MTKTTIDEDVLHTKYYSLRPLPMELKETFELPTDPDSDDENERNQVLDFFKQYGIFYYGDEDLVNGIIIEPDDGLGPIQERHGFQAFKHSCVLDCEDLSVVNWEDIHDPRVKEKGTKAWLEWNRPVVILYVRPDGIALG